MPPNHFRRNKVNIEGLKKRKELMEKNFKDLNERIRMDTENALRVQGALMDINEIITDDEKELKELEDKKEKKVEKKGVK